VAEALALVRRAAEFPELAIRGAHIHIGSQIPDPATTLQAVQVALQFIDEANSSLHPSVRARRAVPQHAAPQMDHLDLGGGFPVPYHETDRFPSIEEFAAPIVARLKPLADKLSFHLEPGRFLMANAGVLVATVQAVKNVSGRRTLVVDAGMNDLLRPALYDAYHAILPLQQSSAANRQLSDVVGPICESADVLARDRELPELQSGAQLAFLNAGAYGFSMASNYNSQPRPAEVLVEGGAARLIRRRETIDDMTALEV
jgi:diaminopimelate decarboxylase